MNLKERRCRASPPAPVSASGGNGSFLIVFFYARKEGFTFGESKCEKAWDGKKHNWPCTDAAGVRLEAGTWKLLRRCGLEKDFDFSSLRNAWKALLVTKGSVLISTNTSQTYLVLETSVDGLLVWPVEELKVGELKVYRPALKGDIYL